MSEHQIPLGRTEDIVAKLRALRLDIAKIEVPPSIPLPIGPPRKPYQTREETCEIIDRMIRDKAYRRMQMGE